MTKQVTAQKDTEIQALEREIAANQAATQAQIQALSKEAQQAITPQQIADYLTKWSKSPSPITVETPPPTAANPNPQPQLVAPAASLPAIRSATEACTECEVKLSSAQSDLTSKDKIIADDEAKLEAEAKDLEAQRVAAAGGTFWHRLGKGAKELGLSSLGASLGAVACHSQSAGTVAGCAAAGAFGGFLAAQF